MDICEALKAAKEGYVIQNVAAGEHTSICFYFDKKEKSFKRCKSEYPNIQLKVNELKISEIMSMDWKVIDRRLEDSENEHS